MRIFLSVQHWHGGSARGLQPCSATAARAMRGCLPNLPSAHSSASPLPATPSQFLPAAPVLFFLQKLAADMSVFDQNDEEGTPFPEALIKALGSKKLLKHRDSDVKYAAAATARTPSHPRACRGMAQTGSRGQATKDQQYM